MLPLANRACALGEVSQAREDFDELGVAWRRMLRRTGKREVKDFSLLPFSKDSPSLLSHRG